MKEYLRIKSDIYGTEDNPVTIDSELPYPTNFMIGGEASSKVWKENDEDGNYLFDNMIKNAGTPDAISIAMGGGVSYKSGFNAEVEMVLFMTGKDAGEVHHYLTAGFYNGIDASLNVGLSLYFAEEGQKFNR